MNKTLRLLAYQATQGIGGPRGGSDASSPLQLFGSTKLVRRAIHLNMNDA